MQSISFMCTLPILYKFNEEPCFSCLGSRFMSPSQKPDKEKLKKVNIVNKIWRIANHIVPLKMRNSSNCKSTINMG